MTETSPFCQTLKQNYAKIIFSSNQRSYFLRYVFTNELNVIEGVVIMVQQVIEKPNADADADKQDIAKETQNMDMKELELPETVFVRDIENRVFQTIILQGLSKIKGITLLEGSFFNNFLGKDNVEGIKGINAEQDNKKQSVNVKVEVNILYGIPIPCKAEEIQTKIAEEITDLTGLHVASVHVVFKNVVLEESRKPNLEEEKEETPSSLLEEDLEDEYTNEL